MAFATKTTQIFTKSASSSSFLPSIYNASRLMSTELFVGGLPFDMKAKELEEEFSQFGKVLEARVVHEYHGFITYDTEEAGKIAMENMDKKRISGKSVRVLPARYKSGIKNQQNVEEAAEA